MACGARSYLCQRTVGEYPLPGYGPVILRTAWCGPACQVVWGLGVKDPRLPDYVLFTSLQGTIVLQICY
jgi:hypothetical protein